MKGIVLALLALSALADPLTLTQFMAGYSQGVQEPETCLENPEMCGEFLGEVVGHMGNTLRDFDLEQTLGLTSYQVQEFLTGLMTGLRLNNATVSLCYGDLTQSTYQFSTIYNAIMSLLRSNTDYGALIEFACSGVSLVNFDILGDCKFQQLWYDIRGMTFDILVKRYLDYSCDINTAIMAVLNCNEYQLQWCGYNIGVVVRELTTWGI